MVDDLKSTIDEDKLKQEPKLASNSPTTIRKLIQINNQPSTLDSASSTDFLINSPSLKRSHNQDQENGVKMARMDDEVKVEFDLGGDEAKSDLDVKTNGNHVNGESAKHHESSAFINYDFEFVNTTNPSRAAAVLDDEDDDDSNVINNLSGLDELMLNEEELAVQGILDL